MTHSWRISSRARAIEPSLIRVLRDAAKPSSLDLGIGQTDLHVHPGVAAAIEAQATSRRAPYGPNLGLPALREAIARHYRLTSSSEVMVTCGVQEALAVAIFGLVEPGDEVLVPDPGFPAYANLVRCVGATPVSYPLSGVGHDLEWSTIEPLITAKTRVILLNTPGNPTGGVHEPENMLAILRELVSRGVSWISDEIYEDYVYDGEHVSPADDLLCREHGVRLSGMSKSHHMMGWRVGWMTGPAELINALKPLHQHLVTSAPTISQHAALQGLLHHEEVTRQARAVFARRRTLMIEALQEIDGISFELPRGAFYIWVDVHKFLSDDYDSMRLAMDLLEEEDVVCVPGMGFGAAGSNYLRLAYTINEDRLHEATRRMKRFFEQRGRREHDDKK